MKFDINRLSQLAGIGFGESQTLTEASNRSYHDGDANDTSDERFGKNQLNELEDDREPLMQYEREDFETHKGEKTSDGEDAFRGMDKGEEAENEDTHLEEGDREAAEKKISDDCLKTLTLDKVPTSGVLKSMYDTCLQHAKAKLAGSAGKQNEIDDVMLEIDEGMLRREILRMKKERLQETRLRGAIRNEIRDIFASLTNDNTWVYGDNKPRNSRKGTVSMGGLGVGFKK